MLRRRGLQAVIRGSSGIGQKYTGAFANQLPKLRNFQMVFFSEIKEKQKPIEEIEEEREAEETEKELQMENIEERSQENQKSQFDLKSTYVAPGSEKSVKLPLKSFKTFGEAPDEWIILS